MAFAFALLMNQQTPSACPPLAGDAAVGDRLAQLNALLGQG
jgi:CO dehydrogenase/acetyl-CoA synthase gamma subunit (corrinoid Fe-S protein)